MLPEQWRIEWAADGAAGGDDALSLRLRDHDELESLSMGLWRHGLKPWGRESFPLGEQVIVLDRFPTLDDIWCLYMLCCCEQAGELNRPASWEAIVQYAADARQGFALDKVPTEQAILSTYQAIVDRHLERDEAATDKFLADALALCKHLAERVEQGAVLVSEAHFVGVPKFQRYVSMLEADQGLYHEDVARGRRFTVQLPPQSSATSVARTSSLLLLNKPVASQFKLWARRDPQAPGGEGYALMLVDDGEGNFVLSADPVQRIEIGWLAESLTTAERQHRGADADSASDDDDDPWYDGSRHEGTLVAAPRRGSALSSDDVLALLTDELALEPIRDARSGGAGSRTTMIAAAAVAAAAVATFLWVRSPQPQPQPHVAPSASNAATTVATATAADVAGDPTRVRSGAKGDPLPPRKVAKVIADSGKRRKFAFIAGVCSYKGERELRAPCRDARKLRDLLTASYGYQRDHIIYMVDDKQGDDKTDGKPTAENMKRQIERFRKRFGDHEDSSFLFFYSGHGGYIDGAHADYGVLQPTGFFTKYKKKPFSHRGWDMQSLITDIKKGVPSKHIMLVIDACYSGWTGAKGGDDFDDKVRSLWKKRAEVILSAASKGQRAWEDDKEERAWVWDGHSALTAFLLRGLSKSDAGVANADKNEDGIITDEELAHYVRKNVPQSVALNKQEAKQKPQFFRLDSRLLQSGQFLFVPGGK